MSEENPQVEFARLTYDFITRLTHLGQLAPSVLSMTELMGDVANSQYANYMSDRRLSESGEYISPRSSWRTEQQLLKQTLSDAVKGVFMGFERVTPSPEVTPDEPSDEASASPEVESDEPPLNESSGDGPSRTKDEVSIPTDGQEGDESTTEDERREEWIVRVPASEYTLHHRLERRARSYAQTAHILPRSLFTALVVEFDAFVGDLARLVLRNGRFVRHLSNRNVTFRQLLESESVEDVTRQLIEDEVESLLRGSHPEILAWFENILSVKLANPSVPAYSKFIEVTQRRHIFVHCGGVVSRQYRNACSIAGVANVPSVGQQLSVSPEYFKEAYQTLVEAGVRIAIVAWGKVFPKSFEPASGLNELCVDLITAEEVELAGRLLDFGMTDIKKMKPGQRKVFDINRALVHRRTGDSDTCIELLSQRDWDDEAVRYRLAVAVLRGEVERVAELMEEAGDHNPKLGINEYRSWPLFAEVSQEPLFRETYKRIFKEDWEIETTKRTETSGVTGESQ